MEYIEVQAEYTLGGVAISGRDFSSAIRGIWGRELRRAHCLQRSIDCRDCPFENCNYFTIFEKQYGSNGQYHPYIIRSADASGGVISVNFRFFGWPCRSADSLIMSIMRTDGREIHAGGGKTALHLRKISGDEGLVLFSDSRDMIYRPKIRKLAYHPEPTGALRLRFITPLRQKSDGQLMRVFQWDAFAKALINRIRYLDQYFNQGHLDLPERIDLGNPRLGSHDLRWDEKPRRSYRQDAVMSIGGLVGSIILEGVSDEMHGILKLGAMLHSGKQCSFGNGYYEMDHL